MSWNEINLSKDIPVEVKTPKLKAGRVTAMIIPGATVDTAGTLFVEASVVAPEQFAGRQIKLRYRDPNKRSKLGRPMAWIAQAFHQLLSAVNSEPKITRRR
jgi:hypothetical protein